MIQNLAYCALVEDQMQTQVPYGLVIYAGEQVRRVEYNEVNRLWLLDAPDDKDLSTHHCWTGSNTPAVRRDEWHLELRFGKMPAAQEFIRGYEQFLGKQTRCRSVYRSEFRRNQGMRKAEFAIGMIFWCDDSRWRGTDVGTRTITAIRLDRVEVSDTAGQGRSHRNGSHIAGVVQRTSVRSS